MVRYLRRFLKDAGGAAAIEYVVLLLPLLALVFTSFQIALAYHFSLTAQKAVENGARVAAVRDPVYVNLPASNQAASGARTGLECARSEEGLLEPCVRPDPDHWTCTAADLGGPDCDADAFNEIFQEVASIAYLLDPDDLVITYRYAGLGFANGPFVPIVEVGIKERPFFLRFGFNLAIGGEGGGEGQEAQTLPSVMAVAIAEDLSSTN